jgi:hypothetical protein
LREAAGGQDAAPQAGDAETFAPAAHHPSQQLSGRGPVVDPLIQQLAQEQAHIGIDFDCRCFTNGSSRERTARGETLTIPVCLPALGHGQSVGDA